MQIVKTTTDQLPNLSSLFDSPHQDEALKIIENLEDQNWTDQSWADIMFSPDGKIYAVKADGALTENDTPAVLVELQGECWVQYDSVNEEYSFKDNMNLKEFSTFIESDDFENLIGAEYRVADIVAPEAFDRYHY